MKRVTIAAAVLLAAVSTAEARRAAFQTGGRLECDDRYPWTCDVRGWEVPASRAPIRQRGDALPRVAGLVAPLATKAAEIVTACGSQIISSVRNTLVAGTRRVSLHATGQAVDLRGNPSCIYSMLHGWPGGATTDYGRVNHVHISYGGREHGLRFTHGSSRKNNAGRHSRARGGKAR
ncbi:hypothetical protein PQJ75_00920 [Rhodoplanes sp. TEM]|uniref:Peptidase M15A C-terminal domain-containing protein n=1 Tax=Rhodoplanes tepidamans TaxID=200616 RepID=A0ABT5J587_RHOTP|nr:MULTISPECIES: hypothetical protein [Rhodoplanes]MDC7784815.1 hypothetical protein [Rhodoplanes tepidamans]MDC7982282.1 hypothetical protein [Rhodoplanes sp. TEM]MDQ0356289.1 hypothetical protein [Rhodoplanes tepidamans]